MRPRDALKRVQLLLAKTDSPSEEEARTSALLACRLIRQHGLVVDLPSTDRDTTSEYPKDRADDDAIKTALKEIAKDAAKDLVGAFIDRAVRRR